VREGHLEEKQKPRGWGVPSLGKLLGWLASPIGTLASLPGLARLVRWLAWPICVLAAALIGGPLVIWRAVTAHVQAQAARHQAAIAQEGHYTGLFTKAVEQLGATREVKKTVEVEGKRELVTDTEPNLEVRLGAIFALERIARDSERDRWPIIEVLCAYVRNPQNCGEPAPLPDGAKPGSDEFNAWLDEIKPPRVDLQAALVVIGRRPPERIAFEGERDLRLDLSGANLKLAELSRGMFAGANLQAASLDGARLNGVHLEGAWLQEARLEGAYLLEAHLKGAYLHQAHLEGAWLNGAHLEGAKLTMAHLEGATLGGAHLQGASLQAAHLEGAQLFDADLSEVWLLDPSSLASALGDATTKLPEGMQRPTEWPDRELDFGERDDWITKLKRPAKN
jgi:Pentapeptide repeats (8 copies)